MNRVKTHTSFILVILGGLISFDIDDKAEEGIDIQLYYINSIRHQSPFYE